MEHLTAAKKTFSKAGLSGFVLLGVGTLLQLLLIIVLNAVYPAWSEHSLSLWVVTFAPVYLIAVPLGLLILRKLPAKAPKSRSMKGEHYIVVILISVFLMYAGNLLGTAINALLQSIGGLPAGNPVLGYAMDNAILPKLIVMVILAPVIEEYIFRKQLIDRMHMYGEKLAVVTSALMFGLFHGNLAQFFYAFALGLVFAYVYLKTGRLRYSIGLHMIINCMGSVIGPLFLEKTAAVDTTQIVDTTTMSPELLWTAAFGFYVLLLLGCALSGLVLFFVNSRKVRFKEAEYELPKGTRFKTVYLNTGMILFVLLCLAMFVINAVAA